MPNSAAAVPTLSAAAPAHSLLDWNVLQNAQAQTVPFPYLEAPGFLPRECMSDLSANFPNIDQPGFFPSNSLKSNYVFDKLLADLESKKLAEILTEKLGIDLTDKPRMITIRKWSAAKDGRIHNDSESKIATSLLYLNDSWSKDSAGRLRVLRDETNFDNYAAEISPEFGNFFAFRRTENSWHGHLPFAGERRVVQITWLRSWEDFHRKEKRGNRSMGLKRLFSMFKKDEY